MLKTSSGDKNLNRMPRQMLMWRHNYVPRGIPTQTYRFRYAGAFTDTSMPTIRGLKAMATESRPRSGVLPLSIFGYWMQS